MIIPQCISLEWLLYRVRMKSHSQRVMVIGRLAGAKKKQGGKEVEDDRVVKDTDTSYSVNLIQSILVAFSLLKKSLDFFNTSLLIHCKPTRGETKTKDG